MCKSEKPLLFGDIDGVLSLFGFASDSRPQGSSLNVDGIVHLISGTASDHLHRLGRDVPGRTRRADQRRRWSSAS
jgi:hypothetical protein